MAPRQTTAAGATGGATPGGSRRWRAHVHATSFGIAALVAAVLLYYSLRGIEWREVGRIAATALECQATLMHKDPEFEAIAGLTEDRLPYR